MTLRELMGNGAPEVEISGLAYSSTSVTPGTLFFCVPGFRATATTSRPDAVERGAVALVVRAPARPRRARGGRATTCAPRWARPRRASTATRPPSCDVVGITGTNGKTTTAFLVRQLLEAAGRQRGLLGTVKRVVGGREEEVERTTPEAIDLQAHLPRDARRRRPRLRDGGLLARARAGPRRRASASPPRVHEPHPGPPRLPPDDGGLLRRQAAAVRGARAGGGERRRRVRPPARRRAATRVTFAIERDADYRARDVELRPDGLALPLRDAGRRLELGSPLPGLFNVQNVLGRGRRRALARRARRRRSPPRCRQFGRVPGRFEPVDEGQDFGVLVDYAHTPDSLENVLRAARELTQRPAARACSAPAATATAPSGR